MPDGPVRQPGMSAGLTEQVEKKLQESCSVASERTRGETIRKTALSPP